MDTSLDEMRASLLTTWLCLGLLGVGLLVLALDGSALDGGNLYAALWGAWAVCAPAAALWALVDALGLTRSAPPATRRGRKVLAALALLGLWGVMVALFLRGLGAIFDGWGA